MRAREPVHAGIAADRRARGASYVDGLLTGSIGRSRNRLMSAARNFYTASSVPAGRPSPCRRVSAAEASARTRVATHPQRLIHQLSAARLGASVRRTFTGWSRRKRENNSGGNSLKS